MKVIQGRQAGNKLTEIKLTLDYLDHEIRIRDTLIKEGFPMKDGWAYINDENNRTIFGMIRTFVNLNRLVKSAL